MIKEIAIELPRLVGKIAVFSVDIHDKSQTYWTGEFTELLGVK